MSGSAPERFCLLREVVWNWNCLFISGMQDLFYFYPPWKKAAAFLERNGGNSRIDRGNT
jgi:hypothetical protein